MPKWNWWSWLGQFMGFSDDHSSLVANVWHLTTGFVSPWYHVAFDDLFQTVFSSGYDDALVNTICNNLFEYSWDVYAEEDFDSSAPILYHPGFLIFIEFSFFVTVLLLLWCCGGNCWGICYCLYQSIIAFQVLKCGSYFKGKRKRKPHNHGGKGHTKWGGDRVWPIIWYSSAIIAVD